MFTDIVGSTTLAEELGDEAWGQLLHWHDGTAPHGADGPARNPYGQYAPAPVRPRAGTTQIYEGTNQIQRMVIARKTFGNVR